VKQHKKLHHTLPAALLAVSFLLAPAAFPRPEELRYESGDAVIACTLSLPDSPGRHPALVLLCGSGLQDRDWDIDGDGRYKMGKLIADPLVGRGIAVLRCDDRGAGKTTGPNEWKTSFQDLTQDALGAVARLKERPDIGPIGIGGLSGGAEIAVMAAAASRDVAFVVSMSGPFVSGADILLDQARTFPERIIPERTASREELIERAVAFQTHAVRAWRTGEGMEELYELVRKNTRHVLGNLPEEERKKFPDLEAEIEKQARGMMGLYRLPYFKSLVEYNPALDLPNLRCPVLAIHGSRDDRVRAELGWKALLRTLAEGDSQDLDVTVRVFPDTNHFLTNREHALKGRMMPGVVELIGAWIWERFGRSIPDNDVRL
jgi:uncharacterized protein